MSRDRSPALILRLPPSVTAASREQLVVALADYDLVAIHEDDIAAPRTWVAHFGSGAARDAAARALAGLADPAGLAVETTDIEDEDWARRTQADLPAVRVGRIVVAPPWDVPASPPQDPSTAGGDIVIVIEPSRGFGTGHHQSTRLCLALLQGRELRQRTMIDVGTGSGVLAIAAARLGAEFVAAIDTDPEAVENARENIVLNHVDRRVDAHVMDLTQSALTPADLVTANLTGTLLARHAGHLAAMVRPGGSLIASGFTVDEKPLVLDGFAADLDCTESAEEDDWWAFVLTRR